VGGIAKWKTDMIQKGNLVRGLAHSKREGVGGWGRRKTGLYNYASGKQVKAERIAPPRSTRWASFRREAAGIMDTRSGCAVPVLSLNMRLLE